jgi:hypothetical protein
MIRQSNVEFKAMLNSGAVEGKWFWNFPCKWLCDEISARRRRQQRSGLGARGLCGAQLRWIEGQKMRAQTSGRRSVCAPGAAGDEREMLRNHGTHTWGLLAGAIDFCIARIEKQAEDSSHFASTHNTNVNFDWEKLLFKQIYQIAEKTPSTNTPTLFGTNLELSSFKTIRLVMVMVSLRIQCGIVYIFSWHIALL